MLRYILISATILISIHLSRALNKETIVSIDDKDKTQYHEVNFDTRSYNFGYEVGTNRQFHHEIRGSDGVTYGCFGYFDEDDKLLMTHYVADAHGYRIIESNKPVKIYPVVTDTTKSTDKSENVIDSRNTMVLTEWKDLFLPRGCRMMENGNFNFVGNSGSSNNQLDGIHNSNSNNDQEHLKTFSEIPKHLELGNTHTPSKKPISGGVSFSGSALGHELSHGIGGNHGTSSGTSQNTNNQQQSQQQSGGSGFGIGGQFTGTHGTQGSFQIGLSKPPLHHGHNHSSSSNSSHGHGHIIDHFTTKKPSHVEHGGSFSHGSISGGHHIGLSHGQQTTTKKPGHFEHGGSFSHGSVSGGHQIIHGSGQTTTKKPSSGHIEHGGSFSHGSVSGGHQGSISWGNQGQTTTHKPQTTTKKPIGGHIEHGGSFSHGSISGSHQGSITWGHTTTTTKKPNNNQGMGQNGYQYLPPHQNNNQGQYQPDYSGSYVHQPGPDAPAYQHMTGPNGGYGNNGGFGNNGGYGPDGGNNNNNHNNQHQSSHNNNQGNYYPEDPDRPDPNCNNPDHNHQTSPHPGPFYTKSTSRRPTTQSSQYTTSYQTRPTKTTSKPHQTYPTRPASIATYPTDQSNLGVQPPTTSRPPSSSNQGSYQQIQQQPIFFVPYPFPIAPSCPCYYMHNNNNFSAQFQHGNSNGQIQWQSQPQQYQQPYAIGLIPVLFVPHCMQSNNNMGFNLPGQFLQVPYTCSQCNSNGGARDGRELNEVFSSSDSFKQVLEQAGIDNSFLVKSQPRKLRMRKLKRVQKDEENEEIAQ